MIRLTLASNALHLEAARRLRLRPELRAIAGGPARFARHLPVERLLFGSGLPFFSPGGMITHVTYSGLPESDQQKILAGNLERLISEVRL